MAVKIYHGDILFTPSADRLEIHENSYIIVEDGVVSQICEKIPEQYQGAEVVDYGDKLIIPAFSDLHVHGAQYVQRGIGMDCLLSDWLNHYTFPQESRFQNMEYAKNCYDAFVDDMLRHGTFHANVFATIHREATNYLFDKMEEKGMYGYVGKVNMDCNSPEFLTETTEDSLKETEKYLAEHEGSKKVKTILVTKDVNLRMKARSLGIEVEDYITDKVINVDIFKRAQDIYENIDPDLIDKMYASPDGIAADLFDIKSKLEPNECFILKSVRNSVLARYNPFTNKFKKVEKASNYGIQPRNAEQSFAFEVLNDPDVKLIGLTGKARTGKTLLALASALKQANVYKQILLARPIVALANKDLGFLPGDEKQKVAPYMQPLFDNLNVIKGQFAPGGSDARKIDDLQKNGQLVIEALAFIRGRSLSETFCIIDEAQNLTPHEIKTIITRAGEGTKMVFTGDIQQIDSPYLDAQSNGLAYMVDKMKGQELFAHINLIKGERSQLSELASDLL